MEFRNPATAIRIAAWGVAIGASIAALSLAQPWPDRAWAAQPANQALVSADVTQSEDPPPTPTPTSTPPPTPSPTPTPTVMPPGRATLVRPSGRYAARSVSVSVRAGSSTVRVTVLLNGRLVGTSSCIPGAVRSFRKVSLPRGMSTIAIVAANSVEVTRTFSYRVRRLDYPWPTCIIIDKSSFRLYWVRNGVLVKSYRIAHGKPSTPTPSRVWRVDSKERSSGVSGPRKLRLFQRARVRHGYRYSRTRYGVHGTNQPWLIGRRVSHGCIRLRNRDILDLWPRVPMHTMVMTRQ